MRQYYYDVAPTGLVMRKYNPNTRSYVTITDATFSTKTSYGRTATVGTYKVKDGSDRDLDGQLNGIIIDPAGPAIANVGAPNTGFAR